MLPTPDISHLSSEHYEYIYEPAEDSFLFLDALEKEKSFLNRIRPSICVEVGSGSGVVSTFLAASILSEKAFFLCTDINKKAADVTIETGVQNKIDLNPVICDLVNPLYSRLQGQVDVLLFNPPYVVTPSEEVGSCGIEASWAGGLRGREVVDRLFPSVCHLLSPGGVFYLVIIKENDKEEILRLLGDDGLRGVTVLERRSGPELLSILKFVRKSEDDVT
ncbi:methyltransferase HEMK2-like [Tubulanus polymorphus]|uniref:methyltransferase HEMK2-like n=1 Tax=Tubulanus polymorphus TaxID=672921 RepID=UPI003DA556E4